MTTNHTPGPWEFDADEITTPDRIKQHMVCIAVVETGWKEPLESEQQANARLISAAPELLEACKTFAEWLRREDEGFVKAGNERDTPEGEAAWSDWYSENLRICALAQTQARAAIAKATGA